MTEVHLVQSKWGAETQTPTGHHIPFHRPTSPTLCVFYKNIRSRKFFGFPYINFPLFFLKSLSHTTGSEDDCRHYSSVLRDLYTLLVLPSIILLLDFTNLWRYKLLHLGQKVIYLFRRDGKRGSSKFLSTFKDSQYLLSYSLSHLFHIVITERKKEE